MTGKEIRLRARAIRALALDVDGVLTDASLYYGTRGEALKRFYARDGFGIKVAQMEGIRVAILSGRMAPPLKARLADLGIPGGLVIQGSRDKGRDLRTLARRLQLPLEAIAFMGDDIPDLPALAQAGLAACPADAAAEVRSCCDVVTRAPGGNGAVRELVELILNASDRWVPLVESWRRGAIPDGFEVPSGDAEPINQPPV
jgi:3-deoxy-D-manno-octulosonate 8-phosphate phosphatase (KDO 8-P phosphatase)